MNTNTVDTQVWYELEYSRKREEDWYSSSTSADTPEAIRSQLARADVKDFEFRAVKKTVTTEVIAGVLTCGHVVSIASDGGEGICPCIAADLCDDCPPRDYPTDETRCLQCPLRKTTQEAT